MKRLDGFEALYAVGAWLWLGGNLVFAAGLLGRLDPVTLAILGAVILLGLCFIAARAREARSALLRAAVVHPWLSVCAALVVALDAIAGMAPPVARDALIHHLALPLLFIRAGRIVDVPFAIQSYYPQAIDMLYVLPVGLGVDRLASLIHLGLGVLAALVLAARARCWAGDRAGILAALLFLTMPVVVTLSTAAYVDLGLCLYAFLALESFLRWREAGHRGPWLVGSALAVGFALSTKYSALLVGASLGIFVLLETVRHRGPRSALAVAALFGALVLVPASPWLVRNALRHRDPFYPLFTSMFGAKPGFAESIPGPIELRRMMYGENDLEIAALPLRIFVSGVENDPRRFDGRLNPFLPFLAAAMLLGGGRKHPIRSGWTVGCFSALGILLTLTVSGARVRYVLPFVGPLCALAAVATAPYALSRGFHPRVGRAVLVAALAWNGFFLLRTVGDPDLLRTLTGREPRDVYLVRRIPAFPIYRSANAFVPRNGKVQLLFMGDQGYYLDVPYTYESYFSGSGLARALPGGTDAMEAYFHRQGVTHLVVNEAILRQFLLGRFGPEGVRAWEAFVGARAVKLDARGPFALYMLVEVREKPGVPEAKRVKIPADPADKTNQGS